MPRLDTPIRPPTGNAWLLSAVTAVITGELNIELGKPGPAVFFGHSFSDSQIQLLLYLAGALFVLCVAWLVSLYVHPGRLCIDPEAKQLTRKTRLLVGMRLAAGAFADWQVKLVYFSTEQQRKGTFKRLELAGPGGHQEILLYADVGRPSELIAALAQVGPQLGSYEVTLQRPEARPLGDDDNG